MNIGRSLMCCLLLAGLAGGAAATEDTDTPGKGGWEINLGVSAARTDNDGWEYGLPAGDINYGVGERGQFLLGGSRVSLREPGSARIAGTGAAVAGLKWRLVDHERAGFSLAVFPQYAWTPSKSAERRGVVESERSVILPVIVGLHTENTGAFLEVGRKLSHNGGDSEWVGGFKILNQCTPNIECRIDLHHSLVSSVGRQSTAEAGFKLSLNDSFILVAGVERAIGRHNGNGGLSINLGIQIVR
ncbi:hypothetical protein [Massilia niastensis]|uniref:hypothetical protein n=1 Tax=Massilia niastensis TaxID=544911 RepID=UPI000368F6E6|nr:hypothetical protein [Massilia niastensis]